MVHHLLIAENTEMGGTRVQSRDYMLRNDWDR